MHDNSRTIHSPRWPKRKSYNKYRFLWVLFLGAIMQYKTELRGFFLSSTLTTTTLENNIPPCHFFIIILFIICTLKSAYINFCIRSSKYVYSTIEYNILPFEILLWPYLSETSVLLLMHVH